MRTATRVMGLCSWLFLLAPAACSSATTATPAVTPSCTDLADSPACPGQFATTCVGGHKPPDTGICDKGTDTAAGKTYCCTGCVPSTTSACIDSLDGVSSDCRMYGLDRPGCFKGASTDDGTTSYCCVDQSHRNGGHAVTTPSRDSCTGGFSLVQSDKLDPDVAFDCSKGLKLTDTMSEYCCKPGTCATTKKACSIGGVTGATYSCSGAAPPSVDDPTLGCGQGYETNYGTASPTFESCCAKVPPGACKPDPTVGNCGHPALIGFSCTGTATPVQQMPTLQCYTEATFDGATQYCCGG